MYYLSLAQISKKNGKFDIFTTNLIIMLLCACMEVNAINEELKSRIDFHGHIMKLRFENLNEEENRWKIK